LYYDGIKKFQRMDELCFRHGRWAVVEGCRAWREGGRDCSQEREEERPEGKEGRSSVRGFFASEKRRSEKIFWYEKLSTRELTGSHSEAELNGIITENRTPEIGTH
jgi:hypothetical protein